MRRLGLLSSIAFVAVAASLSGCGGHGRGFRTAANPVVITSSALPTTVSGQVVNHCLPFTGGSGGPYLLELIDGSLPPGIQTDSDTVCLVGQVLEDGTYDFTLKLTDTGSDPFSTFVMSFHWEISVGPLVFATDANLPSLVFNQFASLPLVVAGGTGPYFCEVVDDPLNAIDEPLPTGMIIPAPSTTIVGAPTGVKGSPPFVYKVSIKATDSSFPTPLTTIKVFTLTVLVPPLVITSTSVADGKCGATYADQISISDGIPPFRHELVLAGANNFNGPAASRPLGLGGPARLQGRAPSLNAVADGAPTAAYAPLVGASGPSYSGKFPEGIRLKDDTGAILGVPRRAVVFNAWTYHVYSTTLPTDPTQNQWKAFSFNMADGNPPAVALDNNVLLPGNVWSGASNFLLDADAGRSYSKQMVGTGGVPNDGVSDAPHDTEDVIDPTEVAGQYNWSAVPSGAVANLATVGMTFTLGGELRGTGPSKEVGTIRTSYITLTVTADDAQLPDTLVTGHQTARTCRFSVGPDVVVISESTAAHTSTSTQASLAPIGSINHVSYEYNDQSIFVYEPFAVGPTVRALASTDLTAGHNALPGGVSLDTLLRNVDMMPVTVNPTWWAYDAYNLNPRAARATQHADMQRLNNGEGYNCDVGSTTNMSHATCLTNTFEHNGDACIELPHASNVPGVASGTFNTATGVYANGGQLRAFEGTSYFGFFIVRKDSKISVPFAIDKATWKGFGDAVLTSDRSKESVFRRLQITVSPDGRFAAAVLKNSIDNFLLASNATNINVVVFSLTGEKVINGSNTFRQFSSGGTGTTNDGQYMYGTSMALTNRALYFVKGNYYGSLSLSDPSVVYREHWVYRVDDVTNNASTPQLLSVGYGGAGNWQNNTGIANALSTAFQRWAPPGAIALGSYSSGWTPSPGAVSSNYLTTGSPTKQPGDVFGGNWANFAENSAAPMPFRVSADGKACAIVAGSSATAGAASTTNFLMRMVYTDYFDSGSSTFSFNQLDTVLRRFYTGTRLSGVIKGDYNCRLWGFYNGPTTQLEVSDDGKAVAVVYNASTGTTWFNSMSSNVNSSLAREDLIVFRSGSDAADPWNPLTSAVPTLVTSTRFLGGMNWKFGALAFTRNATRDAGAVIFWGGTPLPGATTFTSSYSCQYDAGSLFQWNIGTAECKGILAAADGGAGVATYTPGSPNQTVPSSWSETNRGSVQTFSYFISPNGNFVYYESMSALVNGQLAQGVQTNAPNDATAGRLVGVPIQDTTTTLNGKAPLTGFAVGGPWPTDPTSRGFGPLSGSSSSWYPTTLWTFGASFSNRRVGTAVSSFGSNGSIFFTTYQQNNTWGATSDSTSVNSGGGPVNNTTWSDGASYSGDVYAFNANVGGGVVNVSGFGNNGTVSRIIAYMQPNTAGNKLGVVMTASTSTSFATRMADRETVYAITNVNFSATGALSTTPSRLTIESTGGRAGPSMAWDFSDSRLYYAFGTGSGNENGMVLKEASLNSAGTVVTGTRTQSTGFNGTSARFAVLNSGR